MRADTNSRLKNFCNQKNKHLILNDNIKQEQLGIKKLYLNRKGNNIFAKNLLHIIGGNWFLNPLRNTYNENENGSNASIATFSDAKKALKIVRISNIRKLIFEHLNINSLRNKFDLLCEHIRGSIDIFMICEQIKDSIDIFMISETKFDDSFPQGQFLIEGFPSPFRFDRNKTGGGILLYVREEIPAKVLSHDFPTAESFFVEIILHKKVAY